MADPPVEKSCPPKYYRTKTETSVFSFYQDVEPSGNNQRNYTVTTVTSAVINEEGDCVFALVSCTGTHSSSQLFPLGGTYSCSGVFTTEDDGMGGLQCYPKMLEENGVDLSAFDIHAQCGGGDGSLPTAVVTVPSTTVRVSVQAETVGLTTVSKTTTETLSDEIPYSEMMRDQVCEEDQCFETEEDPDCRYCSTPFCGTNVENTNRDGLKWAVPDSPIGCIKPSATNMTWLIDGCSGGDLSVRTTDLTLVAKDLTPGQWYRLDVTYLHCFFSSYPPDYPVVGLRGTFIDPTCFSIGSCAEGSYASTTDTIEFQADHWAEVLSNFCDHCEIMYLVCQLKDEAKAWNDANPLETPRTVDCSAGGFQMPVLSNNYTWVESCSVTEIDPPA